MKKTVRVIILFILLFNLHSIYSLNNISYYIPEQEEIDAFFKFIDLLNSYDANVNKKIDVDMLLRIAEISKKHNILQTYFFESYLRYGKNKNVKKFITNDLVKVYEKNEIYETILREQNAKFNNKMKNYYCGDEIYSEKIDLFHFNEILIFNNQLHSFLFDNEYEKITFTPKKENEDELIFMTGGGTNSYKIQFKRIQNTSKEEFIENHVKSKFLTTTYPNLKIDDLPIEGLIKYCQADKVFLLYGTRVNEFTHHDGQIRLCLYVDRYKNGYIIDYFINFSQINNYYKVADRIFNQLALFILFSWVD